MKNKYVLVTLPHAGGTSMLYKNWDIRVNCDVLNIDYPGHWIRKSEPLADSISELEGDIYKYIIDRLNTNNRILLFGHSMGAILAWHMADRLSKAHIPIGGLFLSGSDSPFEFPKQGIDNIKDEDLLKIVGYDVENSTENSTAQYKKMILPIIKHDLSIFHEFCYEDSYCDIESVVFYGLCDELTNYSDQLKWGRCTKTVSLIGLPGKHLFIKEKRNQSIIFNTINSFIVD